MEESDKRFIDRIIIAVLVIIIVLLLVHNCGLVRKAEDKKEEPTITETGDVLVIDINCRAKCKVPIKDNPVTDSGDVGDSGNTSNNSGSSNTNTNTGNNTQEEDITGILEVFDDEKNAVTWNGSADLKIFTNSMYKVEGKIAPEDTNTYQFKVRNSTDYDLKYNIKFSETNSKNMNMKYKLKKNDTYIVSNWVSYDQLNISNKLINIGNTDVYYLEWKWVSADNDTEIGKNGADYSLTIDLDAEGING